MAKKKAPTNPLNFDPPLPADMASGYSFTPLSDPQDRACRIAYLESVLRTAEIPVLREELTARLTERNV